MTQPRIHPTAEVSPTAIIGEDTLIWHQAQVRECARIGRQCILGKGVYVDADVEIGDCCKIQNGAFVYHGATLEHGVFLGPGVILTNDKRPRAINPEGSLKSDVDWEVGRILIRYGASLGARTVVITGVTIGRWAMAGSGSVITHDVPDYGLVVGSPARLIGFVCPCGGRLIQGEPVGSQVQAICPRCGQGILVDRAAWEGLP